MMQQTSSPGSRSSSPGLIRAILVAPLSAAPLAVFTFALLGLIFRTQGLPVPDVLRAGISAAPWATVTAYILTFVVTVPRLLVRGSWGLRPTLCLAVGAALGLASSALWALLFGLQDRLILPAALVSFSTAGIVIGTGVGAAFFALIPRSTHGWQQSDYTRSEEHRAV